MVVIRNQSSKLYYDHHGTLATLRYAPRAYFQGDDGQLFDHGLVCGKATHAAKYRIRVARP
jgi:hypothetical protein